MAAVKPIRTPAVEPRDAVAQPAKPVVVIGSRWTPQAVIRMDRAAGTFEEVNTQLLTQTESLVQRALLAPVRDPATLQRIEAARLARRVTNGAPQ